MQVIRSPAVMTAWAEAERRAGRRIVLVPTMGFFHEGHLSLMRLAAGHGDRVVVSLFVNPAQFGPGEDLAAYPRDFERDRDLAGRSGVDVLFAPDVEDMYPPGFQTTVSVGDLTRHLCGSSRPGHFDGVATVVTRLFGITRADAAVFGEKDFQQLAVIRRLVADLNLGLEIIGHPIVREEDGLAMSSRNTYLDEDERATALCLYESLRLARREVAAGVRDCALLRERVRAHILARPGTEIDYVALVDTATLEPCERVTDTTLLAMAVRINNRVRLIDNGLVLTGT